MTDPCGAVPPPSIYGRGVHVEPCILAPNHGGPHLPGNQDELDKRPRPSILRAHEIIAEAARAHRIDQERGLR